MIFSTIVSLRNKYFDNQKNVKKSKIPVVSVGNISTGGTGKTPMCIFLAKTLLTLGYSPICIGRNINSSNKNIILLSDSNSPFNAQQIGDELALIQQKCSIPILSTSSKSHAALEYEEYFLSMYENPIYIIDDGFQHRAIHHIVDIVLVDDDSVNGNLLPFGRNREPLSSLKRATIVVNVGSIDVIRQIQPFSINVIEAKKVYDKPYFLKSLNQDESLPFDKSSCFVISSIAKPKKFRNDLTQQGVKILGYIDFKDHHQYTNSDLTSIKSKIQRIGAKYLVTTEKDAVKLEIYSDFCNSIPILVYPQSMKIIDEKIFTQLLKDQLSK